MDGSRLLSRRNVLSSFISKETEVGNSYRRNAPNFKKEGVMRLWSQYCRKLAISEHQRAERIKLLWFRMYEMR